MKKEEIICYLSSSRAKPDEHFEIESQYLFKNIQSKYNCSYGFDFILAHVLKHGARDVADSLSKITAENVETRDFLKEHYKHMTGWADEFYWLSLWELTGEVLPENVLKKLKKIEKPYNQILGAFIQADWADLLLKAYQTLQGNPIKIIDEADTPFGTWITGKHATLPDSFLLRCLKRYDFAELIIKSIRGSKSNVFRKAMSCGKTRKIIDQIESKICFGIAYLKRDIRKKTLYGQKKINRQIMKIARGKYARQSIQNLETKAFGLADKEDKKVFHKIKGSPNAVNVNKVLTRQEQCLTRLHILAEWIGDLLKTEDGFQHPRYRLSPEEYPQTKLLNIPNPEAIRRLKKHLLSHTEYLDFITQSDNIRKPLEEVKNNTEYFKNILSNKSEKAVKSHSVSPQWELFILRDWGSWTPLLNSRQREKGRYSGGGGYFLQYEDIGIVIDPGFDYLKHFFEAGLKLEHITHIIVTHDHYDHSASFGPLLNLLHVQHKSNEEKVKRKNQKNMRRDIQFYLCRGILDQFARYIVDFKYFANLCPITELDWERDKSHILKNKLHGIKLLSFPAQHGSPNGFGRGVGLTFGFPDKLPCITITSDTGWYDKYLLETGSDLNKNLADCIQRDYGDRNRNTIKPACLVLHVGSLKIDELKNSGFYKTHLGLRGVFRCIQNIESCKLAVLSEFGEECLNYRKWVAEEITHFFRRSKKRKFFRCFPSDRHTLITGTKSCMQVGSSENRKLKNYCNAECKEENGAIHWI